MCVIADIFNHSQLLFVTILSKVPLEDSPSLPHLSGLSSSPQQEQQEQHYFLEL